MILSLITKTVFTIIYILSLLDVRGTYQQIIVNYSSYTLNITLTIYTLSLQKYVSFTDHEIQDKQNIAARKNQLSFIAPKPMQ